MNAEIVSSKIIPTTPPATTPRASGRSGQIHYFAVDAAMKLLSADEAVAALRPKVAGAKGRMTVADASAATGLAIEDARTGLEAMMNRFVCRLQVTESGELLYDFGSPLRHRGEKTLKDTLNEIADAAWKVFMLVFKVWITVTLIVYVAVFTLILLALIFGGRSDSKKGGGLSFIGDLFGDLFAIAGRTMIVVNTTDPYGYHHKSYKQAQRKSPGLPEKKKRFVQSVYDFVFGPPRPQFDPFENEKEVVAWLRSQKGVLTIAEIVSLAGWTFEEAEQRMADYLTRFKGQADISDEGVLVGRFRDVLQQGDAQIKGGKVELFWDEFEAPYEMTGNSSGRNLFIGCMNGFNLLFSMFIILSPELRDSILFMIEDEFFGTAGFINVMLGWIPFLFSVIFFLVPLSRFFLVRGQERLRLERNKRRRIVHAVFAASGRDATFEELSAAVNRIGMIPVEKKELERLLQRALTELRGELALREDGTPVYRFPRIASEIEAAAAERARFHEAEGLGKVIFDTGT